jgi:uncharacterized membrane protein YdjX (TVP38/TMEM64 family)
MNKAKIQVSLLVGILILIVSFFIFDFDAVLSFENLKQLRSQLEHYQSTSPIITVIFFFLIYVTGTGLSLPVAGILTIASGAIFGLLWGTVIVSIAGTLGATIAFLISRYLFRDYVQDRYAEILSFINAGMQRNGKLYLLSLRLFPVIPYFIINAVMGLTHLPVMIFSLVTLVGMLPISIIFVNGGTQLASIHSVEDIMSVKVIASFALIAVIPLLAHRFGDQIRSVILGEK